MTAAITATQQGQALELTGKIAADPASAGPLLEVHALGQGNPALLRQIVDELKARVARSTDMTPAKLADVRDALPVARECQEIILQDGSRAIEIHVSVNGKMVRAVLADSSFDKSRSDQESYAETLGGRLATGKENRAVAYDLLIDGELGKLNEVGAQLLKLYCEKVVRDSLQGGLSVERHLGRVVRVRSLVLSGRPSIGALIILPRAP